MVVEIISHAVYGQTDRKVPLHMSQCECFLWSARLSFVWYEVGIAGAPFGGKSLRQALSASAHRAISALPDCGRATAYSDVAFQ
jgi:hypothetical protein